jgi:DNA modification methylase
MAGSRREDLALHSTVKPVAMVADAYQDVTRRGDLVFDMFLGSGTSLIAAERCGRRFRGCDIDLPTSTWRSIAGCRSPEEHLS